MARHGVRARAFACGRCNGVLTSRSISSGAADACQRKHFSPNVGHALACAAARELRRPGLRSGLVPAVSEVPLRMLPKAFAATRYGSRGSCGRACPDNIAIGRRLWAPANWPPPLHKVGSTTRVSRHIRTCHSCKRDCSRPAAPSQKARPRTPDRSRQAE